MQKTLVVVLGLLAATLASAHGYQLGSIAIAHPWATPSVPGARTAAAYLKDVSNAGAVDDRFVGASSPAAARIEIHTMTMDGDVMRMRAVDGIALAPGAHVAMVPGNGYHLMLLDLKTPLKVGDRVPATLVFEKAGRIDVELTVQERAAGPQSHSH